MGKKSDGEEVKDDSRDGENVESTRRNFYLIKVKSLVSLWPLCRVCNTTNLICKCYWDT